MTVDPSGPPVRVRQPRLPGDAGGPRAAARGGRARPGRRGDHRPAPASRCRELAGRARMGDQQALDALRDAGRWLGIGIASAANLLNFQAVVLGGFFAQLATWLAAPIAHELETHVLASEWGVPRLLPSTLGPEAAVRGAAALSLRRVLTDPASAEAGMRLALSRWRWRWRSRASRSPRDLAGREPRRLDPGARRDLGARGRAAPLRLRAERREHLRRRPTRARPCAWAGSSSRTRRTRTSTSARGSCSSPTTRSAAAAILHVIDVRDPAAPRLLST